MATDVEREIHEANTAAWINSDPVTVSMVRETRVSDGAGGWTRTEVTLAPQTFRVDRGSNASIQFVTAPSGTNVPIRFRLVGAPDADVAEGDTFVLDGDEYDVTYRHRDTFGRVAAEVERRGSNV